MHRASEQARALVWHRSCRLDAAITQAWRPTYGEMREERIAPQLETVPQSSTKIVRLLSADYIFVLKETLDQTLRYMLDKGRSRGTNAKVQLPRGLGWHRVRIRFGVGSEAVVERVTYIHAVWMFDRLVRRSYSLSHEVAASDSWLALSTMAKCSGRGNSASICGPGQAGELAAKTTNWWRQESECGQRRVISNTKFGQTPE